MGRSSATPTGASSTSSTVGPTALPYNRIGICVHHPWRETGAPFRADTRRRARRLVPRPDRAAALRRRAYHALFGLRPTRGRAPRPRATRARARGRPLGDRGSPQLDRRELQDVLDADRARRPAPSSGADAPAAGRDHAVAVPEDRRCRAGASHRREADRDTRPAGRAGVDGDRHLADPPRPQPSSRSRRRTSGSRCVPAARLARDARAARRRPARSGPSSSSRSTCSRSTCGLCRRSRPRSARGRRSRACSWSTRTRGRRRWPRRRGPTSSLARDALAAVAPGAAFVGGTEIYFTELNRTRPELEGWDGVCYSITPQIHAFTDVDMVENLDAQAETVRSARAIAEKLVAISPVTLRRRVNFHAAADPPPTPAGELPDAVDVRQSSLFGRGVDGREPQVPRRGGRVVGDVLRDDRLARGGRARRRAGSCRTASARSRARRSRSTTRSPTRSSGAGRRCSPASRATARGRRPCRAQTTAGSGCSSRT